LKLFLECKNSLEIQPISSFQELLVLLRHLSASADQKMQIKISACLLIVASLFILAAARDIDNGNQDTFQR
jgi:hypothetical protein